MKVSISRIKTFKSCRRLFELKYIENLAPVEKAEALEVGANYHELLEEFYTTGHIDSIQDGNYTKAAAMASAYVKYIYPKLKIAECEEWFEYNLADGDKLIGRLDGLTDDGTPVEHKTTGANSIDEYIMDLERDEQILAYMLATGKRKIYYTIIKKPTIRLKKDEIEEEFFNRMVAWYDEDTDSKIRLLEIIRTDDEVARFKDELMLMVDEMRHTGLYYRNTCHCNAWGRRCEFASICMHYDPNQEYVEFVKKEAEDYELAEN